MDFTKGRDSVFQALALIKDDDEYQRKYSNVPEVIQCGRGTSVTLLCDMVTRMKTEIDSTRDAKSKSIQMLQNIADMWIEMLDDRNKMAHKISSLQKEKDELVLKVEDFKKKYEAIELELRNCNKNDESMAERKLQQSSPVQNDDTGIDFDRSDYSVTSQQNSGQIVSNEDNTDERHFNVSSSRFDIRSEMTEGRMEQGFTSQLNSSQVDFTHPLLKCNPYGRLDSTYYNPSKFFQRQYSTYKRGTGKRGGRGGGRKKSEGSAATTTSKANGKSQSRKKKVQDIVVDLTSDVPSSSSNFDVEAAEAEESPDKCYFDYTSTFLDETDKDGSVVSVS